MNYPHDLYRGGPLVAKPLVLFYQSADILFRFVKGHYRVSPDRDTFALCEAYQSGRGDIRQSDLVDLPVSYDYSAQMPQIQTGEPVGYDKSACRIPDAALLFKRVTDELILGVKTQTVDPVDRRGEIINVP